MGRFDEAIALYRGMIEQQPAIGPAAARLMILRNLRAPEPMRDFREAEEILTRSAQALPESTEVIILRAEALVAQGHHDQAQRELATSKDRQPKKVELWIALSELADRGEPREDALKILDDAECQLGDRIELRLARANHWARAGGASASKALGRSEEGAEKFPAIDQERLLRGLAEAYLRNRRNQPGQSSAGDASPAAAL